MKPDSGWEAVLYPGIATDYFQGCYDCCLDENDSNFSPRLAWLCSEISRVMYVCEKPEITSGTPPGTRNSFLAQAGLREIAFFDKAGVRGALIHTADTNNEPFAVLVFRGTHNPQDWLKNLDTAPVAWNGPGRIHKGFRDAFEAVWPDIFPLISTLTCPVVYTGHSLGAALATLAAVYLPPHSLYTFGSPMVGDSSFAATLTGASVFRLVNNTDIVPQLPPPMLGFAHAGLCLTISCRPGQKKNLLPDVSIADILDRERFSRTIQAWFARATEPAAFLSDHAPVNYTAAIESTFSIATPK